MKRLFAISFLLLVLTPALGADGDGSGPMLISYQNQSMVQAMIHEAVQTMNQTMNQTRLLINQTEVTINSSGLFVNATQAQIQLRISNQEMFVNGLQVTDESTGIRAQVMVQVTTMQGAKSVNLIQEQNHVRIMEEGSNLSIQLALNQMVRVQDGRLILNQSGVERNLTVLPLQAMNLVRGTNQTVRSMELVMEQEQALYRIMEQRQARLLWFIPVTLDVVSRVSAENGTLMSQAKPWWSFLAFE